MEDDAERPLFGVGANVNVSPPINPLMPGAYAVVHGLAGLLYFTMMLLAFLESFANKSYLTPGNWVFFGSFLFGLSGAGAIPLMCLCRNLTYTVENLTAGQQQTFRYRRSFMQPWYDHATLGMLVKTLLFVGFLLFHLTQDVTSAFKHHRWTRDTTSAEVTILTRWNNLMMLTIVGFFVDVILMQRILSHSLDHGNFLNYFNPMVKQLKPRRNY